MNQRPINMPSKASTKSPTKSPSKSPPKSPSKWQNGNTAKSHDFTEEQDEFITWYRTKTNIRMLDLIDIFNVQYGTVFGPTSRIILTRERNLQTSRAVPDISECAYEWTRSSHFDRHWKETRKQERPFKKYQDCPDWTKGMQLFMYWHRRYTDIETPHLLFIFNRWFCMELEDPSVLETQFPSRMREWKVNGELPDTSSWDEPWMNLIWADSLWRIKCGQIMPYTIVHSYSEEQDMFITWFCLRTTIRFSELSKIFNHYFFVDFSPRDLFDRHETLHSKDDLPHVFGCMQPWTGEDHFDRFWGILALPYEFRSLNSSLDDILNS